MPQTDEFLQDASEYAVTKIMIQLYCIPGTRRKSVDDVEVKDYTYVIGDQDHAGPAAVSGIITAEDLNHAMNCAIMKLSEIQAEIAEKLREHNERVKASQQIVTAGIRR